MNCAEISTESGVVVVDAVITGPKEATIQAEDVAQYEGKVARVSYITNTELDGNNTQTNNTQENAQANNTQENTKANTKANNAQSNNSTATSDDEEADGVVVN